MTPLIPNPKHSLGGPWNTPYLTFNAEKVRWYILNKLNTRKEKQDYLNRILLDLDWIIIDVGTYLRIPAVSISDIHNEFVLQEIKKVESCTYGSMFLKSFLTKLLYTLHDVREKLFSLENMLNGGSRQGDKTEISISARRIERIYINVPRPAINRLCDRLKGKNLISEISRREFGKHFRCRGEKARWCYAKPITWSESDDVFALLPELMAQGGLINRRNMYAQFKPHFVNQNGEPFRLLSQKKQGVKDYGEISETLIEIIDSMKELEGKLVKSN